MPATRPALPSRYAKPELLAYGGMAEVYRATDESLGRAVAVKVLSERYASDDELHARFLREARTAASLSGEPNVIVIHDVGETRRKLPFIVMELVRGGTVADRLRHGRVPAEQALEWLEQAAAALDRAHERGIVHRDVKPANLLVADDGAIRVSDFGIARAAGNDTLTIAGTVLGSSGYMAPEQARGEATTAASDRYALACVAYELLCGRRPFVRANPTAEAHAHATEEPPSPRAFDASLPAALDAVFARALAKRPEARYESCAAFVDDLRRILEPATTVTAPPTAATVVAGPPPAPPAAAPVTRHSTPPRRTAVIVLVVGLLAAGALLAWGLSSLTAATRRARPSSSPGRRRDERVEQTVTQASTGTQTVESQGARGTTRSPPPPGANGSALNDRGFQLLQQGDPQGALPLLDSAVAALAGSGVDHRGVRLVQPRRGTLRARPLRRCRRLLDRSEEIQGKRKEIDRLRRQVRKDCWRSEDVSHSDRSDTPIVMCHNVSVNPVPVHLGAKGRVVLPASFRRALGLQEGAELLARVEGEGIVLEPRGVALQRHFAPFSTACRPGRASSTMSSPSGGATPRATRDAYRRPRRVGCDRARAR